MQRHRRPTRALLLATLIAVPMAAARAQVTVFDFATDAQGFTSQSFNGDNPWRFATGTDFFGNRLGFSLNGSSTLALTQLLSPELVARGDGPIRITFSHQFNFDRGVDLRCRDGGVLFGSVGNQALEPITSGLTGQGYTSTISSAFGSPLPGLGAFCGPSANNQIGQFVETTFQLSAQRGQRYRFAFAGAFDPAGRAIPDPNWRINRVRIEENVAVVPEPSTYALLATGLAVVLGVQRRRSRH